jgi:AcrR family transcriptional regulator
VTQAAEGPGPEPGMVHPLSRRDRLRAATTEEIIQTARRLLVASGPDAVSLRAIAKEMGMTAPGLYRYFGSLEELRRNLCASLFIELGDDIRRAIHAAAPAGGPPGDTPADGPPGDTPAGATGHLTLKVAAACQEFRRWALDHKAEFGLLFGVPLPGLDDGRHDVHDVADDCAMAFAGTFFALFLELWQKAPFPVPDAGELDPGLREQLASYREALGSDIPLGALLTFLRCWTLLYGAVSMEVFGHMDFALTDPAPMFEITLGDLASLVGLRYPPEP